MGAPPTGPLHQTDPRLCRGSVVSEGCEVGDGGVRSAKAEIELTTDD